MLVGSYFYTYISHFLGFDMDDMILFDTKYFFLTQVIETKMTFLLTSYSK